MKRWLIVFAIFSAFAFACTKTIIVRDEGVHAHKIRKGETYTAPQDGWFFSDKAVLDLLGKIEDLKLELEKCKIEKEK